MKYSARQRAHQHRLAEQQRQQSNRAQIRVEAYSTRETQKPAGIWLWVALTALLVWSGLMVSQAQAATSDTTPSDTTSKATPETTSACPAILNHNMKQLHSSKMLNLCDVAGGKPVLLVNTASHCGFTDQFGDLEKLHERYKDRGLVVIGVSSDSFNQEADSEAEAADVCFENFGVTFTMLSTVPVRGENAHPLFKAVGDAAGYPKWNFYKYLLNSEGDIVESWSSMSIPDDDELEMVL